MANDEGTGNYANRVITSQDIQQNINLLEGRGIPEWWVNNTKPSTLDADRKASLILNFPRGNVLRKLVMGLAWSIPVPTVTAADNADDGQTDEAEGTRKGLIDARVAELFSRKTWEGEKDLAGALPWWRVFAFTTGSIFVKLPTVAGDKGEGGAARTVVIPERMPPENCKLMLSPSRIKVVDGFEFRYWVQASEFFEDDPKGTYEVCEQYTPGLWTVLRSPEYPDGHKQALPWPFAPVSHLQWEERLTHPRGLPLFERLKEKALHVYSVAVDRRQAGKFSGNKMFVRKNAKGPLPVVKEGAVVDIQDASPVKPASFEALNVNTDDTSLRNEWMDALRELYAEASQPFPFDEKTTSAPASGKALRQTSKDEQKYKEAYCAVEGRFLQDLISKTLTMEGFPVLPVELRVNYDMAIEPDPMERRADAALYFQEGFTDAALMALGKTDDEAEEMIKERDESRADSLLSDASARKPAADDLDRMDPEDKGAPGKPDAMGNGAKG